MKDQEKVVLIVQHEAVKVTRTTWRRVAMIVLHGAVSIVSRSQTAFSSFIFGREEKGSGNLT